MGWIGLGWVVEVRVDADARSRGVCEVEHGSSGRGNLLWRKSAVRKGYIKLGVVKPHAFLAEMGYGGKLESGRDGDLRDVSKI